MMPLCGEPGGGDLRKVTDWYLFLYVLSYIFGLTFINLFQLVNQS